MERPEKQWYWQNGNNNTRTIEERYRFFLALHPENSTAGKVIF
jgi:hypothetical protein